MTSETTATLDELTDETTGRIVRTANWNIKINEAGEGHPVIMLHGSGPGATGWSNFGPNIRHLAQRFRCIAVDQIGWGASDAAPNPREHHVSSLIELMDELGIEKAALLGNSMGGGVAQRMVSEAPERVSHLVTMGSGLVVTGVPSVFTPAGTPEGLRVLQAAYRDPSFETMRALVQVMTFDAKFTEESLIRQRLDAALARPEHLRNFIEQLPGNAGRGNPNGSYLTPDPQRLAASGVPTMVVHGRDDRVASYESSLRLVSVMRDSYLVLFNRCGHWAQLEHAERFNRLVEDFVGNN